MTLLLAGAAFALGQALQVNNGFFHNRALLWLTASLVLALVGCAARRFPPPRALRVLPLALCAIVLFQLAQLLSDPPLRYAPLRHGRDDVALAVSLSAIGLLAVGVVFGGKAVQRAAFAGILAAHVVAGVRTIQLVPKPHIDVVTVQEAAIDAIASGRSPYGLTFKNIYGSKTRFYGEGMATADEVRFGYPYPPLALALSAPAHWLFGDYRYGIVAALAAVSLALASFGWTRSAMLSATVLLTTPRVLFEIEQGWTEPFVLMMLVLLVLVLHHRPGQAGIAVGLAMAVKQYLAVALLLVPVMPLGRRGEGRRMTIVSLAVAAAIILPFLLWDPSGFMRSVVVLQLREPFRLDSLSFLAWIARRGIQPPTVALTLVALVLTTLFAHRTLPRSSAGVAAGMALVSFAAFAFGKKAFCNYYFFVIGAMVTAIAASSTDRNDQVNDAGSR